MLRGESMAGRDSLCQNRDGAIPVFGCSLSESLIIRSLRAGLRTINDYG